MESGGREEKQREKEQRKREREKERKRERRRGNKTTTAMTYLVREFQVYELDFVDSFQ